MGHITIVGRSMSVVENLLASMLDEASEKPVGKPPCVLLSYFSALSQKNTVFGHGFIYYLTFLILLSLI